MTGHHVEVDAMRLREWDRWAEDNPGDDGVVRGARPLTEADRDRLREQMIQRLMRAR